jgi:hypothetical protein
VDGILGERQDRNPPQLEQLVARFHRRDETTTLGPRDQGPNLAWVQPSPGAPAIEEAGLAG